MDRANAVPGDNMHHVQEGSCFCGGVELMTSHPWPPSIDVYAAAVPTRWHGPKVLPAHAATIGRNVDETILP
jgi:hypothetical protein